MEIPFIRAVDRVLSGFTAQKADSGSQTYLLIAIPAAADYFCSPVFCHAETTHTAMFCDRYFH